MTSSYNNPYMTGQMNPVKARPIDPLTEQLARSLEATSPQLAAVLRANASSGDGTSTLAEKADPRNAPENQRSNERGATPLEGPSATSGDRTELVGDINQGNLEQQRALNELLQKITNPEYIDQVEGARNQRLQQLAQTFGAENRKRDIEMQNIRSWQAIQQAQIQKEAILASTMATTAYLAHTPNANVIQALQGPMRIAAEGFRG